MKKLLNTLYINSSERYLTLDGENVVIKESDREIGRIPLHNLEAIVTCGYAGASPALMGACAERNVMLSFMTPYGRFLARVVGPECGNVIVRKTHYQYAEDVDISLQIAKNFIIGKLYNSRWVIERATRDHALQLDVVRLKKASAGIQETLKAVSGAENIDSLRGLEGKAADYYFSVFNELILQQKDSFSFHGRNRRPPLDNVNAMLSFSYSLVEGMCFSALE
ncbi:MAG: CRISPR-associated endonuclease Cas1, partial [Lachnospiraceae bacterium]|nr:CRISPR-associated endonuclease Cas1 [Lachnospiraceae bacterium]